MDGMGWDGIYLRQLGTIEHLAVLIISLHKPVFVFEFVFVFGDGCLFELEFGNLPRSFFYFVIMSLGCYKMFYITHFND